MQQAVLFPMPKANRPPPRLLEQIIPSQTDDGTDNHAVADGPSTLHLERPGFSLPMMTSNFRRFNAR